MGTNNTMIRLNETIFQAVVFQNNNNSDPDGRFLSYNVSIDMPSKIVSDGFWCTEDYGARPNRSTLPLLEVQIFTIFLTTQCIHFVLKRLGIPFFVSQVMAGFFLGPSLNIAAFNKIKLGLFPYGTEDIISLISGFGYAMFLFLNGVQMDFSMIYRTGRKAWTIAFSSMMIPMVLGLTICYKYMGYWKHIVGDYNGEKLPGIVLSHSGCSFPVIASLLLDLEILSSELGRLALSSALVMDVMSGFVNGLATAVISSLRTDSHDHDINKGPKLAILTSIKYIAFLALVIVIARPAMRWMVRKTRERRPVKKVYTCVVMIMALIAGLAGLLAHQTVLAGFLLLGLVVPEGPPLGAEMVKQFELFTTWFLMPIFVTCCAMKIDFSGGFNGTLVIVVASIVVLVHLVKVFITIGVCSHCKMPITDGLCLALMLSCKGVVDFCTQVFLYDSMALSSETVAMTAISVMVMGIIARLGVKSLYDPSRKYAGYQKRNVQHLKPNSDLKIVACVHKPSHVMSMKNAIDIFCPTTTNPIVVYVLHLMELVGRSSPIFISHRLQERVSSCNNYSEDVIVTFDLFEHDHAGTVSVSTYTAISPLRFMHDDICYLALDKLASIIVLPFHVRWDVDGSVASKDENIRALNSKVLERAPCSVGILLNRGPCTNVSMKQVAMIFLGGPDDREGICLAKRAIKDCDCTLVVYHFESSHTESNWDHMLDEEVLKSVKGYYGTIENVTYQKIITENSSDITPILSDIANQHDFIIVGRRNGIKSSQTAALENWTEFPELGVIGDLLASTETSTNFSILVVQQQQMPKTGRGIMREIYM